MSKSNANFYHLFFDMHSSSITYNQKVRLAAMRAIAAKNHTEQIVKLKDLLFVKNKEMYRVRYYTNSYHHSIKLRITQALAFLFRLDRKWDDRMLKILLEEANQTNVTHINELILAETIDPDQMLQIIENVSVHRLLVFWFPQKTVIFFFFFIFRSKATKDCNHSLWSSTTCAANSPITSPSPDDALNFSSNTCSLSKLSFEHRHKLLC